MTQIHLDDLIKQHPPLGEDSQAFRKERLQRMSDFYASKLETADPRQASLFKGFIATLQYARTCIDKYDILTKQLRGLREAQDETRPDSKSR
jgi:hypothetical protein